MWKLIIFRYFSQFGNLMVELYQIRMKKLQNHNINIEFNCDFPSLWPSFTILWEYFRNLHQKLTCLSEGINESCRCQHGWRNLPKSVKTSEVEYSSSSSSTSTSTSNIYYPGSWISPFTVLLTNIILLYYPC